MEKQYIDLYKTHHSLIKQHAAPVMNESRDASFALFEKLGFPTTKLENYKYTDLKEVLSLDYGLNVRRLDFPVDPYQAFKCDVPGIQSYLYFVVNDAFYPEYNEQNAELPKEVIVCSLKEAAEKYPDLVAKYYGRLSTQKQDGLVAFNGAFAQDGFFMYVPKNVQCDHTVDDVRFVSNRVTEVFVAENATYEHYKLENTHIKTTNLSTLLIEQQASSNVLGNVITLHNGLTRNSIEIALNGENCETELCGMVIADKKQQVDNFTSVLHNMPNCHSNELFKYVLDDVSKGAFTGRLYVAKDAQKIRAYQTNRNILLNRTAKMRTKPQLEIYADDVKCSHGATIGQLDEQAMFYMRTRGIPYEEARLLLMFAFTADVIDNIRIPALADRMKMLVEKRLRGELSKCEGCTICQ
jgi:Fe-S cluster assembly protein SufD